jgi:dTDP-4-dehydrorhamnose reductase
MADENEQYMVLGASGQLGYELTRQLGNAALPKTKEIIDLTNFDRVQKMVTMLRPKAVINAAAVTSDMTAKSSPEYTWRTNAGGVDNLVKACAVTGTPLIHISCAEVFGADVNCMTPYTETDAVGAVSLIGQTKLAAEHSITRLGQCMCPEFWDAGFRYWVIRTGMIFERPWRHGRSLPYALMEQGLAKRGAPMQVCNQMHQSYSYAPHLAKVLIWLLKNRKEVVSGIYHVANQGVATPACVGDVLYRFHEKMPQIEPVKRNTMDSLYDTKNLALNCSKFNELTQCKMPTWQEGIEEFVHDWDKQ